MTAALVARGTPERTAGFAAQAALSVFAIAAADWIAAPESDFPALMREALAQLRDAIS